MNDTVESSLPQVNDLELAKQVITETLLKRYQALVFGSIVLPIFQRAFFVAILTLCFHLRSSFGITMLMILCSMCLAFSWLTTLRVWRQRRESIEDAIVETIPRDSFWKKVFANSREEWRHPITERLVLLEPTLWCGLVVLARCMA